MANLSKRTAQGDRQLACLAYSGSNVSCWCYMNHISWSFPFDLPTLGVGCKLWDPSLFFNNIVNQAHNQQLEFGEGEGRLVEFFPTFKRKTVHLATVVVSSRWTKDLCVQKLKNERSNFTICSKLTVVGLSSQGRMAFPEKGVCHGRQIIARYLILRFEQVFLTVGGSVNWMLWGRPVNPGVWWDKSSTGCECHVLFSLSPWPYSWLA